MTEPNYRALKMIQEPGDMRKESGYAPKYPQYP